MLARHVLDLPRFHGRVDAPLHTCAKLSGESQAPVSSTRPFAPSVKFSTSCMAHTGPPPAWGWIASLAYVLRRARGPCGVDAGRLGGWSAGGIWVGRPSHVVERSYTCQAFQPSAIA